MRRMAALASGAEQKVRFTYCLMLHLVSCVIVSAVVVLIVVDWRIIAVRLSRSSPPRQILGLHGAQLLQ